MLNQFKNLSCYKEFEMRCSLTGISKVDVLKEIGYRINGYYFFISKDGIFNWFDLDGNHVENPGILKKLKREYIPNNIIKCIIPNGVTHISYGAFAYSRLLSSIYIPDSVTYIDDYAFIYCDSLISITIPNSVLRIGEYAFSDCESLSSIYIPDSLTCIGDSAFFKCKSLISITIPNSVKIIDDYAFWFCKSLKEVIFKGKTLEEVKQMENFPFGIKDESIIKYKM